MDLNVMYKAFISEFVKLNRRMDSYESASKGKSKRVDKNYGEEDAQYTMNRARRYGESSPQVDNSLSSIKVKMPPFCGKNDVDAFLEWEQKVEMIFNCHNYYKEKRYNSLLLSFLVMLWFGQMNLVGIEGETMNHL